VPKRTQKEIYETIVFGDTSALISLAVGSVLLKCLRISTILIPQEVYNELSEISQFNDVHGKAAQETIRMISNGNIEVD
jgi:rRNA-processing protein FCF1